MILLLVSFQSQEMVVSPEAQTPTNQAKITALKK